MLKVDLILQIWNEIDRCQKEKIKVIGLMKYDLSRKIMPEIVELKGKLYSYLIDDGSKDKKTKKNKKVCHKKTLILKIIKLFRSNST